jgi:hypothetical protein
MPAVGGSRQGYATALQIQSAFAGFGLRRMDRFGSGQKPLRSIDRILCRADLFAQL